MIDLEKLRSFYYVIKEDSILKASHVMNKDRSTVNKHLLDVQRYYEIKLFERKGRRFDLTAKGRELFKLVQNAIPALENGSTLLKSTKAESNNLSIITTTGIIGVWLIRKIEKLIKEFEDLHISINGTNSDVDFESCREDIGILYKRLDSKGLSQKKVRTLHTKLFASPEYIKKYGVPKDLTDLKNHKLISYYATFEGNRGNVDWHLKKGLPADTIRDSHFKINVALTALEAAYRGLGIIAIAEEYEYIENSNLVRVLPDEQGEAFDIYHVTRSNTIETPAQKRFLEILLS